MSPPLCRLHLDYYGFCVLAINAHIYAVDNPLPGSLWEATEGKLVIMVLKKFTKWESEPM